MFRYKQKLDRMQALPKQQLIKLHIFESISCLSVLVQSDQPSGEGCFAFNKIRPYDA